MNATRKENRWWEYYFLRYFVGTVAGAVAIVFLLNFPGSFWYHPHLLTINAVGGLGIKEITGIAALGFAFCYVASAPMLLLHATRAQLGLDPLRLRFNWIPTVGAILSLYFVLPHFLFISRLSYQGFSLFMFLCVVGFQVATIISAHSDRFKSIVSFYWKIAAARAVDAPRFLSTWNHTDTFGNTATPFRFSSWNLCWRSSFTRPLHWFLQSLPQCFGFALRSIVGSSDHSWSPN